MTRKIPVKTLHRFSMIYCCLLESLAAGVSRISSRILGSQLGSTADSIRKEINYLGEVGDVGSGYDVAKLAGRISDVCGFEKRRTVAIAGLGKVGSALLENPEFENAGFDIVAGFDSNTNILETLTSKVPLYPASELTDWVKKLNIEIGIIAVPPSAAADCAARFVAGGVSGLVNFSSTTVAVAQKGIIVRNLDMICELRFINSLMTANQKA